LSVFCSTSFNNHVYNYGYSSIWRYRCAWTY
jgi:hypothetical protein